jgi:hypothetical protein
MAIYLVCECRNCSRYTDPDGYGCIKYRSADICAAENQWEQERKMSGYWHEQRVRERAYQIWQQTGCPEGKSHEHWLQAEAEISAEETGLNEEIKLESEGAV